MRRLTERFGKVMGLLTVSAGGLWAIGSAATGCASGTSGSGLERVDAGDDSSNGSSGSATATSSGGFTAGTSSSSGGSTATSGTSSSGSGSGSSSTSGSTSSSSSSGSGGTSSSSGGSSGGIPTTGVCAGSGTRPLQDTPQDAFIDDFEEAALSPGWSSFNDVSPTVNAFQMMQVSGGAVGTAHAGHYAGTGAKTTAMGGFGVGAVYNTSIDPAHGIYCVGIGAFDGVSFWAKAGDSTHTTVTLDYVLPTTNMAMVDDAGVHTGGGDCTTNCFNHPHVTFTLTTSWAQYTAPFAQASGGSATVQGVIQEVAWLSPDSNWDFSLDEIAFYKGSPPTGAVAAH